MYRLVSMAGATALHRMRTMRNTGKPTGYEIPRMKRLKECIVAIACMAIVVYLSIGMQYASYSPHRSDSYLWGVYHVHSTMSDGLQSAKRNRFAGTRVRGQLGSPHRSWQPEPGI